MGPAPHSRELCVCECLGKVGGGDQFRRKKVDMKDQKATNSVSYTCLSKNLILSYRFY